MQAWTPKRAASKTRRKITAIRNKLDGIQKAVSEHLTGSTE